MSKAAHTPTPWMQGPPDGNGICTIDAIDQRDGQLFIVCEVFGIDRPREMSPEAVANADFILRACNAHEQLVAALRDAKRLLAALDIDIMDCVDYGNGEHAYKTVERINAAPSPPSARRPSRLRSAGPRQARMLRWRGSC